MLKFFLSTGSSAKTRTWKNAPITWGKFVDKLSRPHHTNETHAQFLAMGKDEQGRIKDVGGYVGGYLTDGKRSPTNVKCRQLVTLDIDFADEGFFDEFALEFDCAAVVHGTHKCRMPDMVRLRLLIPLDREVDADEYAAISRKIAERIGIKYFDRTTFEVNRLMYWQSTPSDVEYYFKEQKGPVLSADAVLAEYKDWRDQSEWCTYEVHTERPSKVQEDPRNKTGVVGDFCRTFSISAAIERFLPSEYTACDIADRYTYTKGSTHGGVVVYDDTWLFSHHCTDPTSGQLCNAFDLVRIHKFGHGEKTYQEMVTFALQDEFVKGAIHSARMEAARVDFGVDQYVGEDAVIDVKEMFKPECLTEEGRKIERPIFKEPEPAKEAQLSIFEVLRADLEDAARRREVFDRLFGGPDTKGRKLQFKKSVHWHTKMDMDKKGNYLPTANNLNLIFTNDPVLENAFIYNRFSNKRFLCKDVPWRNVHGMDEMRDADYAGIRNYIEGVYNISAPNKVEDALLLQFENYAVHPILEYLKSLEWDGKPRIDTLLHDYFAVENNRYHSEVMRKMLAGAVNRIARPGCKFDLVMMFTGAQGVYKSTFINRLGKGWASDSFNTVTGNAAFEQLQGAWLMEIAELSAIRKAEIEAVKHYITKTHDTYRPAYGRTVQTFPRQCVFFGSTNERNFLRDKTGNRRYLPVHIKQTRYKQVSMKSVVDDLTEKEVDQIWAEAVQMVLAGEKLYLEGDVEKEAERRQMQHSEVDERKGVIENYLDLPKPKGWDRYTVQERRVYVDNIAGNDHSDDLFIQDTISPIEIWAECFGGDRKDYNARNARFITEALESLGWEVIGTRTRGWYGRQRCYSKMEI